ncbi:MAG TPA: sugar transferase [Candidatus Binataceae bacterium]|nr:sugar transferase [Candidatus Binataceae bacterium]
MFAGELQKQKALFMVADAVALAAASAGALWLHDPSHSMEARLLDADPILLTFGIASLGLLWILVFRAADLYRMRNGGLSESVALVKASSIAVVLTLFALFAAHIHDVSRATVMLAYLLSVPFVQITRGVVRTSLKRAYANPKITIPLVIIGFNPVAHYLLDQLLDGISHYEPVGFLDDETAGRQYRGYPLLGGPERLEEIAARWPFLEAAVAIPDASRPQHEQVIGLCESNRVRWWVVPWMLSSLATGIKVDLLGTVPLIGPRGSNIEGLNAAVKRGIDLVLASSLLLIASPLLALAAALIWITDGRPILFRQGRVGIHGRTFELLKLRTMRCDASETAHRDYVRRWIRDGAAYDGAEEGDEANQNVTIFKIANDNRITPVGRILRRFSIDELPQLINVLRGEMSLIGPRPALPYEVDLYRDWHHRRLDAAPGITGLWQVSGRNRLSFDEMVRLDVQYLEDWSLAADLKILLRTLPALVRGSGV